MPIRILVLTEDTSHEAVPTFHALLKRIVNFYDSRGQPVLEVRPGDKETYPRVGANFWRAKSERSTDQRRELCKAIATALALGEIVLFHTDADSAWSTEGRRTSEEFETKIRRGTSYWLGQIQEQKGHPQGWAADRTAHLVHVVPAWSIEAWTYQATSKAVELCRTEYGGRDAAKFQAWGSDRALLDEVERPKEQTCLRGKHNAELAAAFPTADVFRVGKSFAHFVEHLRGLSPLTDRMRL